MPSCQAISIMPAPCSISRKARSATPPTCPDCSAVIRPDVVLFGELLPGAKIRALEAELSRGFDAVFSVGTSSLFPYIAQPVFHAASRGVATIEINPGETDVSGVVRYRIAGGAADTLGALWDLL